MYSGANTAVKADNNTALKFFKKAADMVGWHFALEHFTY